MTVQNPHDRFFKETFSRLEIARDFFAHYLPAAVTAVLNLDTLSLQPGSFIDPDLQRQSADLLYRVELAAGGEAYLYTLLEHKSYADPLTPFQLLRYMVRIWERDVRDDEPLRPILPLVVYHGRERWRVETDFGGLFVGPEALRSYWPRFSYELQDLSTLGQADIRGAAQLQIGLLVLKYIFDPALRGQLRDILALFHDLAETETALEYLGTVLYYIGKAGTHLTPDEMVAVVTETLADKGSEIMQTVADYWIEQGIEQGRVQTLQEDILALLDIRFGAVTSELKTQVTAVTDVDALRHLLRQSALVDSISAFVAALNDHA